MIYKDGFIDFLKSACGKAYINGSKTEIITFCPYCEGTHINKRHGHLYISVNDPIFYCQKCAESGFIVKLIAHLGGNSDEYIDSNLFKLSSKHSYTKKTLDVKENKEYQLDGSINESVVNYSMKTDYLFNRIGCQMDLNKIPGLVLSVKNFLKDNNVELDSYQYHYIDTLEETFIGFVSNMGSTITMRNCIDDGVFRYYKLPLFHRHNPYYYDFYGIQTGTVSDSTPHVVLAEGVFDILVPLINKKLETLRNKSVYWACALGKGSYERTLISVLAKCKLVKSNIHVLSDSDVPLYRYKSIRKLPYVDKLHIYWNKKGKDFGKLPIEIYVKELFQNSRRSIYAKSSYK